MRKLFIDELHFLYINNEFYDELRYDAYIILETIMYDGLLSLKKPF